MDRVVKTVNYIFGRSSLIHRQFKAFLQELESAYSDIPLHNNMRWLSGDKVLSSFVKYLGEIKLFLLEKNQVDAYRELEDKNRIAGTLYSCNNEGEPVLVDQIDKNRCYSCICKNGHVECRNICPSTEGCFMIVEEAGWKKCKGCVYDGQYHKSHTEWQSPKDPCTVLRCEAGVVTESNMHCSTTCPNPLPPEPGQCCPTCPECKVNGQTASDDRDIVISDDPCLKCRCSGGRLVCSKKACPVLQCPQNYQVQPPGECCPRCQGTRALILPKGSCLLQSSYFTKDNNFSIDMCTNCTCKDETSICKRAACPILHCAPKFQISLPGSCCKKCNLPENIRPHCLSDGRRYEDGQQWKQNSCESCICHKGQPSCAITKCNTTCAAGTRQVSVYGECCPKCVGVEGSCMAFGDPHYKTFDGKIYDFKGIGKYQLTADCVNYTFSVRVANVNRGPSSSTKRVAVKYEDIRINLQQRGRIKYNGRKINPPAKVDGKFRVEKKGESLEVILNNGIKIYWNGRSFIEVTTPATFKKKLCGLCGNFNANALDDLKTKSGKVLSDKEILAFGASWCVGKKSECEKKIKSNKLSMIMRRNSCKLFNADVFTECRSKLNYDRYYKACKMDMGHCSRSDVGHCMSGKFYCESLMAYARECERLLGVSLHNWQKHTGCNAASLRRPRNGIRNRSQQHHRSFQRQSLLSLMPKTFNITRSSLSSPIPLE